MKTAPYIDYFTIGVFSGLPTEITKLKLSFINGKFIKLFSEEFEKRLKRFCTKQSLNIEMTHYNSLRKQHPTLLNTSYVFFPISLKRTLKQNDLNHLLYNLLIMYPSNIRLLIHIDYDLYDDVKGKYESSFYGNLTNSIERATRYRGEPMKLNSSDIKEASKFIRLLFERKDTLKDYDMLIGTYLSTFFQHQGQICYVFFCMSLESLIDSTSEITHQIARLSAIINGETKEEGNLIYANFKKFYELRSKIVHGSKVKREDIDKHYFYLQAQVSHTIVQLVYLNIPKKDLSKKIIECGFGEKKNFVKRYIKPKFNKRVEGMLLTPFASHMP